MTVGRFGETERAWRVGLERALHVGVGVAFQPIVDLRRGTVTGYETLARFDGPPAAPPDRWFAAAAIAGINLELEIQVWRSALRAMRALPPNTFLSINASPDLLASPQCAALAQDFGSLQGLVIEVTEHVAIHDYERLGHHLARYRAAGAAMAVDDAGAGYASMQHIIALKPEFVKIDRAFVDGCDTSPAKAAFIEMIGTFAAHLDAMVLAEGIERHEELETLIRLGVPLGQGYLLARPGDGWVDLLPDVAERIQAADQVTRSPSENVAQLIETAPICRTEVEAQRLLQGARVEVVVVVDAQDRPVEVVTTGGSGVPMRIKATSAASKVIRRALARPAAERFLPLVCTDDDGAYAGIVRIELLVGRLLDAESENTSAA